MSDCEDPRPDTAATTPAAEASEDEAAEAPEAEIVHELRKQLIEKDTLLTETRLEALSSVHQLESLKVIIFSKIFLGNSNVPNIFQETVNKMKCELSCLKQDNEKLSAQVMIKIIIMLMMIIVIMKMILLGEHQVPGLL